MLLKEKKKKAVELCSDWGDEAGREREGNAPPVVLSAVLSTRVTVATVLLPPLQAFDKLDEVRSLLGLLDEAVLEELLGRRALEGIALETSRDELSERTREGRIEGRWRVSRNDEEDLGKEQR